MQVLLINPASYAHQSGGDFSQFLTPMPPIGMAYLLAVLEKENIEAAFFDDFLAKGDDRKLTEVLLKHRPEIVGIPIYTSAVVYRFAEISSLVRSLLPDSKIISGNLHANYYAKDLLRSKQLDIVVKGEGEVTLPKLVKALTTGASLQEVSGIIFRDGSGKIIETPNREYIEDINTLPYPAWHLMPYKKYNIQELGKIAVTGTFILGSRGCPFACDFCCVQIQGTKCRRRTPQNICDEIEWLIRKFNYKSFHFIDALWPIDQTEALAFCGEIHKRGLHKRIVWGTETRIDTVNKETLGAMRSAGCRKVMFGIESGNQNILDSVNKKNNLEKIRQVVQWSHELGLSPTGFFIIGLPGETEAEIKQTIAYAKSLKLHFAKFSYFVPYPGTKLFNTLKSQNLLKNETNWCGYTSYPTKDTPPVYLPEGLDLQTIIRLQKLAHLSFYFRPRQIYYTLRVLRYSFGSMIDALKLFVKLLK